MKKHLKKWLRAASIRAVKTVFQTAAAMLSTSILISEVDWPTLLSAAVLAGIYSLCTSLAGLPEVTEPNDYGEKTDKGYDGENGK